MIKIARGTVSFEEQSDQLLAKPLAPKWSCHDVTLLITAE
jgi:hypothetical protein